MSHPRFFPLPHQYAPLPPTYQPYLGAKKSFHPIEKYFLTDHENSLRKKVWNFVNEVGIYAQAIPEKKKASSYSLKSEVFEYFPQERRDTLKQQLQKATSEIERFHLQALISAFSYEENTLVFFKAIAGIEEPTGCCTIL